MAIFGLNGIGMDLGSMQTSIYLASEEQLVLREPTQVLVNADNIQEILCVGNEARAMSGRTSRDTELISPIQNGVVADIDLTALLMLALAEKATGRKKPMEKALLVTGLMGGATRVERSALFQAMNATGAKRTAAVLNPVAAALGAEIDIDKPRGTLVASLGAGATVTVAVATGAMVAVRAGTAEAVGFTLARQVQPPSSATMVSTVPRKIRILFRFKGHTSFFK